MSHDQEHYDDDAQLTAYIWRNYRNLLTKVESLVVKAYLAEEKAAHAKPEKAGRLRERWGANGNSDVMAAMADGQEAFRNRVRDRILKECEADVVLNRCEECSRLVMTPQARQCLWCGYDWH